MSSFIEETGFRKQLVFSENERSWPPRLGEPKQCGASLEWEWSVLTMNQSEPTRCNKRSGLWLLCTKQVLKSHVQAPSKKHNKLQRKQTNKNHALFGATNHLFLTLWSRAANSLPTLISAIVRPVEETSHRQLRKTEWRQQPSPGMAEHSHLWNNTLYYSKGRSLSDCRPLKLFIGDWFIYLTQCERKYF